MIQAGVTGPPHAPERRVRVWSDRAAATPPRITRAITGAPLPAAVVSPVPPPPDLPGDVVRQVFEIAGLPDDERIAITIDGETCEVLTLPAPGGELRLLAGSCFHIDEDRGRLAVGFENLRAQDRPHLRLQAGDQLYLDAGKLPDGPTELARTRARYERYWRDPEYSRYLRAGANMFTADDHDFWNDYPYRMPHLSRSHDGAWRKHAEAARILYHAYQAVTNPGGRTWFDLDLGLVSLFMLDTRTRRGSETRFPPKRLFDTDQRDALLAWSAGLAKPGILVSSMPLFQKPDSKVLIVTTDHNLLSFPEDARTLWQAAEEAAHDVLVLAGDIHQGRVTEWRTGPPFATRRHYEVVSSPLCLLSWPNRERHPGSLPPAGLQLGGDSGRRDSHAVAYASGIDHFTLLRFNTAPSGVRVNAEIRALPDATIPRSDLPGGHPCRTEILLS